MTDPPDNRVASGAVTLGSVYVNSRRLARAVGVAVAVLATAVALIFIAVGARRRAPHSSPDNGVPSVVLNLALAAFVVYVALALVVFLSTIARRESRKVAVNTQWHALLAVVAFMVICYAIVRIGKNRADSVATRATELNRPANPPSPRNVRGDWPYTWGLTLGLALVVLIGVGVVSMSVLRRRALPAAPLQPDRRLMMATSIDDLVDELEREPDPRRAVILADHGMEVVLAQHGLPRAANETANEYVRRVVGELSLSDLAAETLTELYALAHFSSTPLSAADRESALASLLSVRDELRTKPLSEAAT